MELVVNVLCRNMYDDRVIPRFSRYLRDHLGWPLTTIPIVDVDAYYLSGYFEYNMLQPWPDKPVAAYFTHREEQPPGNPKAKLFDRMAANVDLRIATAAMYAGMLADYGPTVQITPPVERNRFVIPKISGSRRPVAGFSGFTYKNQRKGEDLARALALSKIGRIIDWRASGRGWPVPTRRYSWSEMPTFYQSLDILVVTSLVEGVPMPPLEALACGVSIIVPRGVGLLDELPDLTGIHRYRAGDIKSMVAALAEALEMRSKVDRQALRAITDPFTIAAWCEQHRQAFEEVLLWSAEFTA